MISLLDISSTVESFKIMKVKRNFKKIIMIFVLDTSSIVQSFQNYKI